MTCQQCNPFTIGMPVVNGLHHWHANGSIGSLDLLAYIYDRLRKKDLSYCIFKKIAFEESQQTKHATSHLVLHTAFESTFYEDFGSINKRKYGKTKMKLLGIRQVV